MHQPRKIVPALLLLLATLYAAGAAATPHFLLPKYHLEPRDLGIIINDADPLSVRIGEYYQRARDIPPQNVIRISFPPGGRRLLPKLFAKLKTAVDAATPEHVQAYALTWARPYRVGCMSVTAAFAFGFDPRFCNKKSCDLTPDSPYFDNNTAQPYTNLGIRPTMAIAAMDIAQAKALVDRGIAADGTRPAGTAYLVSTNDKARNVRHIMYPTINRILGQWIDIATLEVEAGIRDRHDILFYFTGVKQVPFLDTLAFRPGAMADHLTSYGGIIPGKKQMNVLRWLEAGATGSYGAVIEPCNHLQKFPNPGVAMHRYLAGETLIEAYWKSVMQPSQGLFVGEPLARPYGGHSVSMEDGVTVLKTRSLGKGQYRADYAPSPVGPYRQLPQILNVPFGTSELRFKQIPEGIYRLHRVPVQPDSANPDGN